MLKSKKFKKFFQDYFITQIYCYLAQNKARKFFQKKQGGGSMKI